MILISFCLVVKRILKGKLKLYLNKIKMIIPYFIVAIVILAFIIYPLTRGDKKHPEGGKSEKELLIDRIINRVRRMSSAMVNNVQLERALFNHTGGIYAKTPVIIDDYDIVATTQRTHYDPPKTFLLQIWDEEAHSPRALEILIKEVIRCICEMAVEEGDSEAIIELRKELTASAKGLNYIRN